MNRREAILGVAATTTLAAVPANAQPADTKLKVDIYSRHLQWLRDPAEVAAAAHEMGFDGVDITVRPYPGHVDPAKVAADLPAFVKTLRGHGISVSAITAPISDAGSPNAEAILDTASQLGIRHYWWGSYRYDLSKPIAPQIDGLKPRVAALAKLNEKYGMKAMYHNFSGPGAVGATILDFLPVLNEFDPRFVGFHYDTGHALEAGGNSWTFGLLSANQYIGGISYKDIIFSPPSAAGGITQASQVSDAGGRGRPPTGWRPTSVPLGTGMLDLAQFAQILKRIGFDGPVEIQSEYPNGGANDGLDTLSAPKEAVLGAMRRDLDVARASLVSVGLI